MKPERFERRIKALAKLMIDWRVSNKTKVLETTQHEVVYLLPQTEILQFTWPPPAKVEMPERKVCKLRRYINPARGEGFEIGYAPEIDTVFCGAYTLRNPK